MTVWIVGFVAPRVNLKVAVRHRAELNQPHYTPKKHGAEDQLRQDDGSTLERNNRPCAVVEIVYVHYARVHKSGGYGKELLEIRKERWVVESCGSTLSKQSDRFSLG